MARQIGAIRITARTWIACAVASVAFFGQLVALGVRQRGGVLFAIDYAPNMYVFVPFLLPFVFGLVWCAFENDVTHRHGSIRAFAAAREGRLCIIACVLVIAAMVLLPRDLEVAMDRLAPAAYTAAEQAYTEFRAVRDDLSDDDKVKLHHRLRSIATNARAQRGRGTCLDEAGVSGLLGKQTFAGVSDESFARSIATYFCSAVTRPVRDPFMGAADRVHFAAIGVLVVLFLWASVGLARVRTRQPGGARDVTAIQLRSQAGRLLIVAAVLALTWFPLAQLNYSSSAAIDPLTDRIPPLAVAPIFFAAGVAITAVFAPATLSKRVTTTYSVAVAVLGAVASVKPDAVTSMFRLTSAPQVTLVVAGILLDGAMLLYVAFPHGDEARR